ncbi:MAG: AIR carboxylase family protein, partial [Planctomycetota bacterium]|jgi:small conductance mechanosensitive channel
VGGALNGLDALLSTVNMPGGVPVGTVGLGSAGAKNAALFAAQILGTADAAVAERVAAMRKADGEAGQGRQGARGARRLAPVKNEPAPLWKRALAAGGKRAAVPVLIALGVGVAAVWMGLLPDPATAVIGPLGMAWRIALIVGLAAAAIAGLGVAARRIEERPVPPGGTPVEMLRARMRGLARLTWALGGVAIAGVAMVMVLGVLNIPITPIVTVAGLSGLAASLAAKTILANVIAGTEMLLDDTAAPGELVTVAGVTGRVHAVGLRTITIESADGALHRVQNGDIRVFANHSRRPNAVVLEVLVGYEEDPSGLVEAINDEAAAMAADETLMPLIPGADILALGVQRLDADQLTARVQLPCAPLRGDALAREFRDRFGERIAAASLPVRPPFAVTAHAATELQPAAS